MKNEIPKVERIEVELNKGIPKASRILIDGKELLAQSIEVVTDSSCRQGGIVRITIPVKIVELRSYSFAAKEEKSTTNK